jgi:hypothetical protein
MSAKTMAEVLMVHFPNAESGYPGDKYRIFCDATGCDFASKLDHYGAAMSAFIAHQAAALSAAGFGLVADAKAEAWAEGWAARAWRDPVYRVPDTNPYRATP